MAALHRHNEQEAMISTQCGKFRRVPKRRLVAVYRKDGRTPRRHSPRDELKMRRTPPRGAGTLSDGAVAGYAYAGPFRTRQAYRYMVEDSIYVAPWARGRGVAGALLDALI
ncbi:MAG TPA: GNAT family N-acetyltransferase, partial [Devosia sp.]|nr:GNAT family N-acetyltransferase [Devosia sp.]